MVSDHALNCPKCGSPIIRSQSGPQNQYAPNGQYGPQQNQYGPQPPQAPYGGVTPEKSNVVAGILALFLGTIGVHYFYLGKMKAGITFLLVGTLGWIIIIPPLVVAVMALISAIKMLTSSQADFERNYVYTKNEFPI